MTYAIPEIVHFIRKILQCAKALKRIFPGKKVLFANIQGNIRM